MAGRHRASDRRRPAGRHRVQPARSRWVAPVLVTTVVVAAGGVSAAAALIATGPATGQGASFATPPGAASTPPAGARPTTATTRVPSVPVKPTATVAPKPTPSKQLPLPDFAVTVTGRYSWVEVDGPTGTLFVGMLRHGRTLSYTVRPLAVTIGDAGAVRLVWHHHVHAPAGRPGEVIRLVTATG
jgi:Domain of unknown function (DUF4115)